MSPEVGELALDPDYLAKARHNEQFLETFSLDTTNYLDWSVTEAFYVAVRCVDAHFCPERPGNHQRRSAPVRTRPRTRPIFDAYRELFNQSREARYELADFSVSDVKSLIANELSRVTTHMKRQ